MKAIRRILNSSLAGTAVIGCLSLLLFLALCSTVFFILRQGVSTTAPIALPTVPIPTKFLQPTVTATPILYTATVYILPTNTVPPTQTPTKKGATAIQSGTVSPEATSIPIKATPARSCVPARQPQEAKVVDVIDGDTIAVMLNGLLVKVKYIGIDAPESISRLEYMGKEARNRNRELLVGRDVLLYKDVSDRDRFDHLLRYVFVDDKFINYELVSQGYARAMDEPPDTACALLFKEAENSVKAAALGIWAPHAPLPEIIFANTNLIIFAVNKVEEFVDIQNVGDGAIDLNGWKLVSELGKEECKLSGVIHPYETVRLFSGIDQPGFSCDFAKPIWDDKQLDPAVLYDPDGNEVARYQ